MTIDEIKTSFGKIGIIPVVVLDDVKDAEPLADALYRGGLPCAEVTFRTDAAEESIRKMSAKYPDMLVGAGTVLTKEQVDRAVAAGAKFIVSPGLNPEVVKYCQERGIPVTPGTQTPSEMELAMSLGLDLVKFFPAEPAGGIKMIKAVAAAYVNLSFMLPTSIRAIPVGYGLSPGYLLRSGWKITIIMILLMTGVSYLLLNVWPYFRTLG